MIQIRKEGDRMEKLREKVRESLSSVLPITIIVLLLSIVLIPMEVGAFTLFLAGALFLIFGMGFFQLGADISMTQLGQGIGGQLMKKRNLLFIIGGCFLMGVLITISEPDLQVLANQVASIPNQVLVLTVAIGVGCFLVAAVLRILFKVSLSRLLTLMYVVLFLVALATPSEFLAVAFDSGGVTTGPMTVPFIMALGIGLSSSRSDKDSANDSFGLIALSSIGPILMVLLLGIFYHPTDAVYTSVTIPDVETTKDVLDQFIRAFPQYTEEVLISMLPILAVFMLFQIKTRKYHRRQLLRMCVGFLYHRRTGLISCRRQYRFAPSRKSAGRADGFQLLSMASDSRRTSDRLLYCKGRACRTDFKPSGRRHHRRHGDKGADESLSLRWSSRSSRTRDVPCPDRNPYLLDSDSRISARSWHELSCAADSCWNRL